MTPENKDRQSPERFSGEQKYERRWIERKFDLLREIATSAFAREGRGAVVVDTTSQPVGTGYVPLPLVEQFGPEILRRLARDYDPAQEFILMFLKPEFHISIYQLQLKLPRRHRRR